MSEYVYLNITSNHFKVWGFDAFTNTDGLDVIAYYGRIGVPMQNLRKHEKHFNDWHRARKYILNKINEKLCKGYIGVPNHLYFQMIQSPRGIAALIEKLANLEIGQQYWQGKRNTG